MKIKICERCKIPMQIGIAIGDGRQRGGERYMCIAPCDTTLKDPKLMEVWKCSKCGHSEYITTMQWFYWTIIPH